MVDQAPTLAASAVILDVQNGEATVFTAAHVRKGPIAEIFRYEPPEVTLAPSQVVPSSGPTEICPPPSTLPTKAFALCFKDWGDYLMALH